MTRVLSALVALLIGLPAMADETSEKLIDRIAFGSCGSQERPQPIWKAINETEPDMFLFLGDNIYGDTDDMAVMRAKYQKLGQMPGVRKLLDSCEILATWDDHDYGRNDAGENYPMRDKSQTELLDFFGVPKDSPRRDRKGVYYAKIFGPEGKRVQVIMLDTRYFRSDLKSGITASGERGYVPNTDPDATMLGEAQWKWLEEQFKKPAELRVIGSSIQFVPEDHRWEKWMNIPAEREKFLQLMRDTKAEGVIFLSGDRHLAELSMMDGKVGYPIYDLTSSGLNQASLKWRPLEVNQHRVATMQYGNNFGLIEIDWDADEPAVELQIRDEEGVLTIRQRVPLSKLKQGTWGEPMGPPMELEGVFTPQQALGKLNSILTVEMEVKSTGQSQTGSVIFLNSKANFRDDDNFTVVLTVADLKDKIEGFGRDLYEDKKVRVTGLVSRFRDSSQIVVKDAAKIQLVEE